MKSSLVSSMVLPACLIATLATGCGSSPSSAADDGAWPSEGGAGGAGGGNPAEGPLDLGGSTGSGNTGNTGNSSCMTDADCDDGDPCTQDACLLTGSNELTQGTCTHASNGTCLPPPVEMCAPGCAGEANKVFPAAAPLASPGLPADCSGGFELNNPPQGTYTIDSIAPGGSAARTLDVQIATYLAPDHIRITGIDASNAEYAIVDTCSIQTASYSDPTNGCTRPPEDSIRQYEVSLKAGTKSLEVDVSGACTPIYLRVLGLCDFTVTPFFAGCRFRTIP